MKKWVIVSLLGWGLVGACSSDDGVEPVEGDGDHLGGGGGEKSPGDGDADGDPSGDGDGDPSGDGDGDGDPRLSAFEEYCEAVERYMCEFAVDCFGAKDCAQAKTYLPFLQAATCTEALVEKVEGGAYDFNVDVAATCIPEHPVCAASPRWLFDYPCVGAIVGAIPEGDDCEPSWTFLAGETCQHGRCTPDSECNHTCAELPGEGEDCDISCRRPFACEDGSCRKRASLGDDCGEGSCEGGLSCSGDDICEGSPGVGDSCAEQPCGWQLACKDDVCVGQVEEGDECGSSRQCPSGLNCFASAQDGPSTCQKPLVAGEPCPGGGCNFELGYVCVDSDPEDEDDNYVCVKAGAVGEPCEPYGCEGNLWCKYTGEEPQGVCAPQGGLGDDCASDDGPQASSSGRCLSTTGSYLLCIQDKCREQGELGDRCDVEQGNSCLEGTCSPEGICTAPAAEGETCAPQFAQRACELGTYCEWDTEKCLKQKPNGTVCNDSLECAGGACMYDETSGAERCADGTPTCY